MYISWNDNSFNKKKRAKFHNLNAKRIESSLRVILWKSVVFEKIETSVLDQITTISLTDTYSTNIIKNFVFFQNSRKQIHLMTFLIFQHVKKNFTTSDRSSKLSKHKKINDVSVFLWWREIEFKYKYWRNNNSCFTIDISLNQFTESTYSAIFSCEFDENHQSKFSKNCQSEHFISRSCHFTSNSLKKSQCYAYEYS